MICKGCLSSCLNGPLLSYPANDSHLPAMQTARNKWPIYDLGWPIYEFLRYIECKKAIILATIFWNDSKRPSSDNVKDRAQNQFQTMDLQVCLLHLERHICCVESSSMIIATHTVFRETYFITYHQDQKFLTLPAKF